MADGRLFESFFIGGFECSCHRPRHGRRLDMLAATGHDRHAAADYARLRQRAILAARDGIRWHLIEPAPGRYDWSSAVPMIRVARDADIAVIWDLCHYGWPDWLDIFSADFPAHFARFADGFARLLRDETDAAPFISPINEISFFAWAGGDVAYINPLAEGRGGELKTQLVRAAIAASEAIWAMSPGARIVHADPVVNVVAAEATPESVAFAARETAAQYEAWDMLCGRVRPELGGAEKYLDIVGVNYYPHNQWWLHPNVGFNPEFAIPRAHPRYRPFREILAEVHARYGRPLIIAETGAGDDERPAWLRYVGEEARAALSSGVPLEGICLYPIVNFPWWDDGHHLDNGLWDYPPAEDGARAIYLPLADELARQQRLFARTHADPPQRVANQREHGPVTVGSREEAG